MAKNNNDELIKYAKYAGIGLVAYTVLRPILASAKAVADVAVSASETKVVKEKTGLTSSQITLCNDVADKLNLAMYDKRSIWSFSFFGGSFEDEEGVITQLNRISTFDESQYVSTRYGTVAHGMNLKNDVDSYLSSSDIRRIPSDVYSGLK